LLCGKGQHLFQRALLGQKDLGRGKNVICEKEVRQIAELAQRLDAGLDKRSDIAQVWI
jgi:hypothetical protein